MKTSPSPIRRVMLARRRAPGSGLSAPAAAITRYQLLRPPPGFGASVAAQTSASESARSSRSASLFMP